jgi:hypothetical protein
MPPRKSAEGARGAQRKRLLECLTGSSAIMLHQPDDERAQGHRGCVIATMGDGCASVANGGDAVGFLEAGSDEQELVAPGEQAMGASVVGLQRQRPLEQRHRLGCLLRRGNVDMRKGTQNEVVGIEIVRPFALNARYLRVTQTRLDGTHHAQRDFVLQRKNVIESAVVALRPKMNAGFSLHELGTDPNALVRLADAAFQHIAHA